MSASGSSSDWRSLLTEARDLTARRQPDDAAVLARRAADDARAARDVLGETDCLTQLGFIEHARLAHLEAITVLHRARALAAGAGDAMRESRALREIGIVHDSLGDYDEALASYLEARRLMPRETDSGTQASLLNSIGIVFSKAGNHAEGLEFYEQAVSLHEASGRPERRAPTLNNMGINLSHLGRLDEARRALHQALELLAASVGEAHCAGPLANLARVHQAAGDPAAAEKAFRDGLALLAPGSSPMVEADVLLGLGELLTVQGRLDEAAPILERGLALAEGSGSRHQQVELLLALSRRDERAGDPASALRRHVAYHDLERRLFNERSDAKLRSLQIRHQVAELERQTLEDSLTGVANRRLLDRELKAELARARRHGWPLAIALCDLDHFKYVNDHFSHVIGDATLRAAARRLAGVAREGDIVARLGGEEFALLMPETDAEAAARACEDARRAVESHDWESVHRGLRVTVSVGWAVAREGEDDRALLRRADERLYEAKRSGRNRVVG